MIKARFPLSVLIDAGTRAQLNRYQPLVRTLCGSADGIEFVVGLNDGTPAEVITQVLSVPADSVVQAVPYKKSDTMSPYSELTFSAQGECLLFTSSESKLGSTTLRTIVEQVLHSQEKMPLKELFFWGSPTARPLSYTLFGEPSLVTESGPSTLQFLLVNRRNWLRAIALDNSLLRQHWSDRSWHEALSSQMKWNDLSAPTAVTVVEHTAFPVPETTEAVKLRTKSELDQIIPPEIKHDEFYHTISDLASTLEISTILEIGSSSGGGSTEAFVNGLSRNPHKPMLFCLEVSLPRFEALEQRYGHLPYVRCLNASSVPVGAFPSKQEVEIFYTTHQTILNQYPLEQVLGWLDQDLRYISEWEVPGEGIEEIKARNNIPTFDMVLIDGSEFSGEAELKRVYGARYILLDDVASFKNYTNRERLLKDADYELLCENLNLRNGYSVFRKREPSPIRLARDAFLRDTIQTYQPKKIIQKTVTDSGVICLLSAALPDQDICLIKPDTASAATDEQLCQDRSLRHIVLMAGDAGKQSEDTFTQAAAVALGRFHYRPDLIVLEANAESFIKDWTEIEPQLLKNCLVVGISIDPKEVSRLSGEIRQRCPLLQEVTSQPDSGTLLLYYEFGAGRHSSLPRSSVSVNAHPA